MSISSSQKPRTIMTSPDSTLSSHRQTYSQVGPHRVISPERVLVQQPGRPINNSVQRTQPMPQIQIQNSQVNRVLDFKSQTSPVNGIRERFSATSQTENKPSSQAKPSINPISQATQFAVNRTHGSFSRLGESSISSSSQTESITQQLERKNTKSQMNLQKENIRNENIRLNSESSAYPPQKVIMSQNNVSYKDKFISLQSQLKDIEQMLINQPRALSYMQIAIQTLNQVHVVHNSLLIESQQWKNKCSEIQMRLDQVQANREPPKDQEYNKLKQIMESLQMKLTVLVDENSKLSQQILQQDMIINQQRNQQRPIQENHDQKYQALLNQLGQAEENIKRLQQDKEETVKRFIYERQILEREKDKLQKQSNDEVTGPKSSSIQDRQVQFKLEQAEMKLLNLQISNDELRKELQHRELDQKMNENLRNKLGILEQKIQDLIKEKENLMNENESLQNKFAQIKIQVDRQEIQCKNAINENNDLRKIKENLINDNESLSTKLNQMKVQFDRQDMQFKNSLNENNELRKIIEMKQQELKSIQIDRENLLQQIKIKLEQKDQEIAQIQMNLQKKSNDFQREKQLLEQEIRRISDNLLKEISSKETIEYERGKLRELSGQTQQELNRFNVMLGQLREQNQNLTQYIEQYTTQY